jgi:hypothetical protein
MNALRQRTPRLLWPGFLAFLRKQPCCVCGTRQRVEASHIRMGSITRGIEACIGLQTKPDDKWAVPLCDMQHRLEPNALHNMGEENFWRLYGINPFVVAESYQLDYAREFPDAAPPYVRKQRAVKARKPRDQRAKIRSRNNLRRAS